MEIHNLAVPSVSDTAMGDDTHRLHVHRGGHGFEKGQGENSADLACGGPLHMLCTGFHPF